MKSSVWKAFALFEFLIILCGMALGFIYVDYRAGALPYTVGDILSLIGCVASLGLLFGGFVGWAIVFAYIMEKREEGG